MNQVHIDRIDQRRRYLEKRIEAKRSVGWETVYDESERAALAWALEQLRAPVNTVEFLPGGAVVNGDGNTIVTAALDQAVVAHRRARAYNDEHDTGTDIPGGGAV